MKAELLNRLIHAGMRSAEAERKAQHFDRATQHLDTMRGSATRDIRRWYVPGRIEVLGKHTDYAGGHSLLCAVERGFCAVASPRNDATVKIVDVASNLETEFPVAADLVPGAGWSSYPMTVARRLARNFSGPLCGMDLAFVSDLPRSAGMSSSSALMIATFVALFDINYLEDREEFVANIRGREGLAGYLACIENGRSFGRLAGDSGVGTSGGSEDHVAILCCRAGSLSQYAFSPIRAERQIPLPDDLTFVIGVSGVAAEKTGAARTAYNRAARAAAVILEIWCSATGRKDATLSDAVTSAPDAVDQMRQFLARSASREFRPQALLDRLGQFVLENQVIIPAATEALAKGEMGKFSSWVDQSQAAAEKLLGNQIPETIELAHSARKLGAIAASAFGAGFGGSVWALTRIPDALKFANNWTWVYQQKFPHAAATSEFFLTRPGPAILRL
jgi:galactokinase